MVAYQLLHRVARLERGASALVQGAAGSIGGALLQLGHANAVRLHGMASTANLAFVERVGALSRWRPRQYSIQELRKAHPDWYREDLETLFSLLRSRVIAPRVFRTMPLESAREALQLVSDGRVEGKLILTT